MKFSKASYAYLFSFVLNVACIVSILILLKEYPFKIGLSFLLAMLLGAGVAISTKITPLKWMWRAILGTLVTAKVLALCSNVTMLDARMFSPIFMHLLSSFLLLMNDIYYFFSQESAQSHSKQK